MSETFPRQACGRRIRRGRFCPEHRLPRQPKYVTFTDYYDDKAETIDFGDPQSPYGDRLGTGYAMMRGDPECR